MNVYKCTVKWNRGLELLDTASSLQNVSYTMFIDGRYLYFTKIVAWENFSFALVLKLHQHGKVQISLSFNQDAQEPNVFTA
jgi:hypothetical protein